MSGARSAKRWSTISEALEHFGAYTLQMKIEHELNEASEDALMERRDED